MKHEKEYTILEESATYYILKAAGDQDPIVMAKRDYVPPKKKAWRDVTGFCEASLGMIYDTSNTASVPIANNPSYRVIALNLQQAGGARGIEPGVGGRQLTVRNVFIVECQEPA